MNRKPKGAGAKRTARNARPKTKEALVPEILPSCESTAAAPAVADQPDYALDELIERFVDAVERVGALAIAAHFQMPYSEIREGSRLKEAERERLRRELKDVAQRDEAFLKKHGSMLDACARFSAMQSTKLEELTWNVAGDRPLLLQEVLGLGAIMFWPLLLIFALILISELRRS